MNTVLVWIMVALGPNPQPYAPQSHYQYATQVDCQRARGALARYDDRVKRQWTCVSIRVAGPYEEEPLAPSATDRAQRNYRHEQETIQRILSGQRRH